MTLEIRTCAPDELAEGLRPIWQYFGSVPSEDEVIRFGRILAPERVHLAQHEGKTVGAAGAYSFRLTVPGGEAPCAGVTIVGVDPTHRRRGILRDLMRAQLDAIHALGEPVAMLWASEETIYGRFGYGMAALCGRISVPREHNRFRFPLERTSSARLVEHDEALARFPEVYDAVQGRTPGMFARTPDWWEVRRLLDVPEERHGAGVLTRVLFERDGSAVGYALYRHRMSWAEEEPLGTLEVKEALGMDAAATAEVWRYLLDVDWVDRVRMHLLPLDHPLFFLLERPRKLSCKIGDGVFVRLVDVVGALAARTYEVAEAVTFEVADAFCPWNEGRVTVGPEGVESGGGEVDLRLDVRELGSVYLGGFSFVALAEAGLVEELRPGALARADALFATARQPWCPEIF